MAERVVQELIAVTSLVGPEALLSVSPDSLRPVLLEGSYDATTFPELAGRAVHAALQVAAPGAVAGRAETAQLHLMLPPAYPGEPAQALVTAGQRRRDWEAGCSQALQRVADEAATAGGGGREVLYELVQALQAALAAPEQPVLAAPAGDGGGGEGGGSSGGAGRERRRVSVRRPPPQQAGAAVQQQAAAPAAHGSGDEQGTHVALLRLDHMRDRAGYSRLIRGWAGELGLSGRLLFLGSGGSAVILLLLEGPAAALREYLVRHRTQNVDVDSKGRPCRERMMSVVCEEARTGRSFPEGFGEEALGSMAELEALLEREGLAGWAQVATGLPAAAPGR
eukprot:scaffold7.g3627.t1